MFLSLYHENFYRYQCLYRRFYITWKSPSFHHGTFGYSKKFLRQSTLSDIFSFLPLPALELPAVPPQQRAALATN
jgi:hypothetical protein